MNKYELLLAEADSINVCVVEKSFKSKAKGLCKGNKIGISSKLDTNKEKACVLAEELGHYHKTVGNILDQSYINNRKQELIARGWGYEKLIDLADVIRAHKVGINDRYELAEYLNVTDEFLQDSINYYKCKLGLFHKIDNYILCFEPLWIIEKFKDF
ncbi:ImmA/IrrE family metallo-endopeptidase [Clostridium sp. LP20]|uniref:ImmA/IrrE family metallo-endopeptidase n=1 Tax=Clostridium sp. LP20 TaxID=3418665 RepID=UPI003EE4ABA2